LAIHSEQSKAVEEKIQQFRELFADAPELGKKALENALHELRSQTSDLPPAVESAGRGPVGVEDLCAVLLSIRARSLYVGNFVDASLAKRAAHPARTGTYVRTRVPSLLCERYATSRVGPWSNQSSATLRLC